MAIAAAPARTATVYTKSETPCVQCDMTLKAFTKHGLTPAVVPGIDTLEMTATLEGFKERTVPLASAPIVVVHDENGREVDAWAGFRPDKISSLAA